MNPNSSLQLILVLIVVVIVTLIMSIYGVFSYTKMKNKHHQELTEEILTSTNQLKDSIRPYIESYAPDEYLSLIANEMKHSNILAITVEDYPLGKILGEDAFISGNIRDLNWKTVDFESGNESFQKILQTASFKRSVDIFSKSNDEKIALLCVYGTDKFLNEELNSLIIESVLITVLIYLLLIGGIYYGINLFMIHPIQVMVGDIKKCDKDGIPLEKLSKSGSKELLELIESINNMIDTVKDSREKLQEQKEEFEMIFNSAQDGIAIVDLQSRFLHFNQAYLEMTGYTKEELLQLSCMELTINEDKEEAKKRIEEVIKEGKFTNFEKHCVLKENKVITVNMSMSLLPDKKRILLSVKDVTRLKVIESQVKLASMGEMIGNIAHQWRQPLSIISTSASGAKIEKELGVLDDKLFDKHMDSIIDQTEYLSKTIDDFRNFIKEGSKDPKPIKVVGVLEKALVLVESSFKNNYIKLVKTFEFDCEIMGYENELIQALINIFNNAKDAIKENLTDDDLKLIMVETKKLNDKIVVSIKDNAGGVPLKIKNRIFEPYFTTKHQSVGTGIGLSLARTIFTDHHNAIIDCENQAYRYKGKTYKGACFKISFVQNIDL